jgi:hypothetical protein
LNIEKFQLRGNNSVWAGAFQLLRGRSTAQLTGNIVPAKPKLKILAIHSNFY